LVLSWCADYERLGGGRKWLLLGQEATSYAAEAVGTAVRGFSRLERLGLELIVAVISNPLGQMGARVLSMALHTSAHIEVRIVGTLDAAEAELERPRSRQKLSAVQ